MNERPTTPANYTRHVEDEVSIVRAFNRVRNVSERSSGNTEGLIGNNFRGLGQKAMENQICGRGGTGRRKGLKIPGWQRRVGSSPSAAPLAHAIPRNRSARWKHAVGAVE